MQKRALGIFFLVNLTLLTSNAFARTNFTEEENLLRGLEGAFVRTFAKENLLLIRITSEDEQPFRSQLAELNQFVKTRKSTSFYNDVTELTNATNDLTNRLNYIYYNFIGRAVKDPSRKSRGLSTLSQEFFTLTDHLDPLMIDIESIDEALTPLREQHRQLLQSYKHLLGHWTLWPSANQSRRVVMRANFMMREAIAKVFHDFERLKRGLGQ